MMHQLGSRRKICIHANKGHSMGERMRGVALNSTAHSVCCSRDNANASSCMATYRLFSNRDRICCSGFDMHRTHNVRPITVDTDFDLLMNCRVANKMQVEIEL